MVPFVSEDVVAFAHEVLWAAPELREVQDLTVWSFSRDSSFHIDEQHPAIHGRLQ